jgi:hypothetical protein
MKKFFIVAVVLCVASASAMTAVALKTPYTPPTNAYWQIIDDGGDNVLACVLDGQTVYGNGDDCRIFNTDTLDFTGVTGDLTLGFDISLINDDVNDHCLLQLRDSDDASWTTFEDFDADTAGYEPRSYDLIGGAWGDWTVYDSVFVRLRWQSDGDGTSDGVRINNFAIAEAGNAFDVNEDFEGYSGGDDMATIGWGETVYQWDGHWYVDADGGGPGSGLYISADDDDINVQYDVAAWAPESSDITTAGYTAEFDNYYNDLSDGDDEAADIIDVNGTVTLITSYTADTGPQHTTYDLSTYLAAGDDFMLGFWYYSSSGWDWYYQIDNCQIYYPVANDILVDDFEGDLALWTVVDQGSENVNIKDTSLGTIKGMYR